MTGEYAAEPMQRIKISLKHIAQRNPPESRTATTKLLADSNTGQPLMCCLA